MFVDLSTEFSPCFKLFGSDPDADERSTEQAQVFLATAPRNGRLGDGALHKVRIPDMILRAESPDDDELLRVEPDRESVGFSVLVGPAAPLNARRWLSAGRS